MVKKFVVICGIVFLVVVAVSLFTINVQSFTTEEQGTTIPPEAKVAQERGYDILVLPEDTPEDLRKQVTNLLTNEYGDLVLTWTVEESTGPNYVYAYPFEEEDSNSKRANDRTQSIRAEINEIIQNHSE